MKQKRTSKKKKIELYDDSWMYILLLTTLLILITSVKSFTFTFSSINLSYSIFLLPFLFFITNYITKKYGYKRTIVAISASSVGMVLFNVLMSLIVGKSIDLVFLSSSFSAYVTSQFVNLTIYYFLLQNTNLPFILVFLTNIFALLTLYMFYTLISISTIVIEDYWKGYFLTILFQIIPCLVLAKLDMFIKKGQEIIKD